ncbi:MAG: Hsp20/alpha crystallin family protein [Bacillales bacterium]|jgi:HSP20 family protein|nr:Hsp20/alpha crystallin family protein [Bacillales bacterium]
MYKESKTIYSRKVPLFMSIAYFILINSRGDTMTTEKKNDLMDQFHTFTKNMDEIVKKKFGNGLFQSIENFMQNISLSSDMQVEWVETDSEFLLKAKIAGVPKESIAIDLLGNQIKISYFLDNEDSKKHVSKCFNFHYPVEEEKIEASHKDGLLTIKIPKSKKKNIQIK